MSPETDPVELLLENVLDIMRNGYCPAPKLIHRLRRFNSEFAALCRANGFSFNEHGVLIMPQVERGPEDVC